MWPEQSLLRRLRWTVLKPLATRLGGDHCSLVRGPGLDLAELREYQPGDDVRRIDWNVTARSDRPFVREAFTERSLDVWLLLDLSASIDWGTAHCLKRQRAVEIAGVVAELLGHHGNRVAVLPFAARPLDPIPPTAGRAGLLRLLAQIARHPRQAGRGRTDLRAALARANTLLRRRALVLVVSDFIVPDGWQAELGRLAYRHEVVAVRLADPRESELPDVGLVTLEDPETGAQLIVDTADARLRERFTRAAEARAEALRLELARRGVDELVLSTGEDLLPPLTRFLEARRQRRGTRRAG
jgi:uncharacterized protein (DUF58 family)